MGCMARVQGDVVLQVGIIQAGSVARVRVISGHPMLQQAAMDAVRQWRYRPLQLKDQATEVEAEITLTFKLGGS